MYWICGTPKSLNSLTLTLMVGIQVFPFIGREFRELTNPLSPIHGGKDQGVSGI